MIDSAFIFNTVVFAAMIIIGNVAIYPVRKRNKQSYNAITTNFMRVLSFILIMYSIHYGVYSYEMIYLDGKEISIGGEQFTLMYMVVTFIQVAQITFTIYLYKRENLYTLPAVVSIFVILYTATYDNEIPFILLIVTTSAISMAFFLSKGKKNRDGTMFGYGLLILLILFTDVSRGMAEALVDKNGTSNFFMFTGQLSGFIFLALGTWGVYERHFLYDKEREAKIKSSWISQIIVKESKKSQQHTYGRRKMFLECPVCHKTGKHVPSAEEVRNRYQNTKGIVKLTLPEETICPHSISVYIDRKYSIRGYETPKPDNKVKASDHSDDQIPPDVVTEEMNPVVTKNN